MDNRTLRSWLNKEGATEAEMKLLYKVWDVALLWGSFDGGYYTIKEIARELRLTRNTVSKRLKMFKENFPEGYEKAQAGREMAKRVGDRQYESFRRPKSLESLKEDHGDEIERHIKETF